MKNTIFTGAAIAIITPMNADGSVNYGDGFTADDRFTRYTIIHPRGVMTGFEF